MHGTFSVEIAKDYYRQIYQKDIAIDGVNRNPNGQGAPCFVMPEIWLLQQNARIYFQM